MDQAHNTWRDHLGRMLALKTTCIRALLVCDEVILAGQPVATSTSGCADVLDNAFDMR